MAINACEVNIALLRFGAEKKVGYARVTPIAYGNNGAFAIRLNNAVVKEVYGAGEDCCNDKGNNDDREICDAFGRPTALAVLELKAEDATKAFRELKEKALDDYFWTEAASAKYCGMKDMFSMLLTPIVRRGGDGAALVKAVVANEDREAFAAAVGEAMDVVVTVSGLYTVGEKCGFMVEVVRP